MDEYLDVLDAQGKPTGRVALKSEVHQKGLYHATVHVWFHTPQGQVLLQQRGKDKDTHPLLWDVSVAGHIGAGEAITSAAVREVDEEIGLQIGTGSLSSIGRFTSVQHHPNLLDREFQHCFLSPLNVPLQRLSKQESEVADLKLISLEDFKAMWAHPVRSQDLVPHSRFYYQSIFRAIEDKLE
ncbi:NUDIX hydrolase [Maribacter sp. 2307ULW6-5]|uniref:NUDIX hydrolase n=1 Tax=Maribacter sp. 2307ULW6-5 TaxID=3386275 RepID=UPI0039BD6A3E